MMFKTFATYLYIVLKHLLLKFLQKKLCEEQNQKSFSEYDWEELIYSGDIRSSTHSEDLIRYLHHYSREAWKISKRFKKP